MIQLIGMIALLQGATTPPSGDTLGYWQQRVGYTIVATLDENQAKLHARGTLVYVNDSPDTLREMYVHQYLNAFRPGSKWSASDQHENRERFQNLRDPDYGYERFTAAPTVNGLAVTVDYPGSPDSTVAHFRLPRALAPHDSLRIVFEWDARPSTVPRRQARRGRTWDFAQWYPKVAVYDRGGWEPNPLVPAGELYGEYGTYDVTMVVRSDQVLAATGVRVSGDPGWARVSRNGAPYLGANAYESLPPAPDANVPDGYRAVRFVAENVHHFAWSASPDYRYEGGIYTRPAARTHFQTWDTVGVHVLYRAGDDTTWGGGIAVSRTLFALRWLESIWGPYAYPQLTNVHRIDAGGTEFPMMIMDGSDSQGLILHEGGHVFTYGILGNNEWRSGWMDEGLTDYQTDWAQGLTPQEQIGRPVAPARLADGYRVNAVTIPPSGTRYLSDWELEVNGRAQPIGIPAYEFSEFGIYNAMIYNRAKLMYGQLRALMGDEAFRVFLHDYYSRWALKHVDERAMRASAERAYGHDLGWFFSAWVHGTGLMDYGLGASTVRRTAAGYETTVRVDRHGELRQAMPVGVLTSTGWTTAKSDPLRDHQDVVVSTSEQPQRVQLDPYHVTWDWDRRNDINSSVLMGVREPRITYDWPYLDQSDRSHTIVALAPALWYSNPQGGVIGVRAKTNYLSTVDLTDGGIAFATRDAMGPDGRRTGIAVRPQIWARAENLYLPGAERPLMGYGAGVNLLDGLLKLDLFRQWDLTPFVFTPGPAINARAYATIAMPTDSVLLPEQWSNSIVGEVGGTASYRSVINADGEYNTARASVGAGFASPALSRTVSTKASSDNSADAGLSRGYLRAEGSVGAVRSVIGAETQLRVRLFGGVSRNAPRERAIFASSQDPFETFNNDLFRARGALLKQSGINYLPLGGAGLRGFGYNVPLDGVGAANGELVQRLGRAKGGWGLGTLSFSVFGDAGFASATQLVLPDSFLADAGAGLILDGRFYDRTVHLRLDAPVFVNHASLAGGRGLGGSGSIAPRWTVSVGELW